MFLLERPIELRISPVRVDGEEISHVLLLCFYVYRLQPCYNLYTGGETQRSTHASPSHIQAIDAARGSRPLQDLHIYDFHFHTSLLHFIRGDTRSGSAYLGGPRIQIDENQKGESTLFNNKFVETDCLVFSATQSPP